MINKLTEELEKTNQRLNGIKSISVEDIEQKLTKQVEKKNRIKKNVFFLFSWKQNLRN
jgi:hypothetical protein